jgi:CPA2 family monovalent cation:H+ antiporter-2
MASQVLLFLGVPASQVMDHIQKQRASHYLLMRDIYRGEDLESHGDPWMHRLSRVDIPPSSRAIGIRLGDIVRQGVTVNALIRSGRRLPSPKDETLIEGGDVLILFGSHNELHEAEDMLRQLRMEGQS